MRVIKCFMIFIIFLNFTFCNKRIIDKDYTGFLDSISSQKYYSNDILPQKYEKLYGTWEVIGTSGGFAGSGYTPDFNYLVIKPNLIFGIIRKDSLITYGKIEILNQIDTELFIKFKSIKNPDEVHIEIVQDPGKYVDMHHDTLNLNAPCCDRFNTHLRKIY